VFDDAAGTYAANITEVDSASPSVSFDVVQWLSGQDAIDAYHEDNPSDPDGPPNDYYIVNDSEQVRTAPIADDATVWLVRLATDSDAAVDPGTVEELPGYLDAGFESDVYWLTFDDGEVTEICEQYRP